MNLEQMRTNMVEQQIRTWEVLDQDVLDLLYIVPREEFVPQKYRALAFTDMEIPLEEGVKAGQRMWQPKMEARVLQELGVRKTDRVLEVGTGSGYFTALLSHRAAQVCSVEINPALAAFGRANLERHGADNITLEIGDAARGWSAHAPYDVIVLTGSTPLLPAAVVEQLAPGGRLFAVVGEAPAMTARLVVSSAPGAWRSADLFETVIALLGVCEPWEWQTARIEGATHMPMREVPARAGELDKGREVVAICHHGGRSQQVAMFLEKSGFAKIHNLQGGLDAWSRTVDPAVPVY